MKLRSPAKINLFLHIQGKRRDGYHELASLIQAVSLFDEISVALSDADSFSCSDSFLQNSDNLAIRARNLFRKKTGIHQPVAISLKKNIPAEAGLGGGSGNAATVFWGMNRLFGEPAEETELQMWSAELGSDIPFFFSCGTAYCTGRGEVVQNIAPLVPQKLAIVKPETSLSTKDVYSHVKEAAPKNSELALRQFLVGKPCYQNDLEVPAFHLKPELKQIKENLLSLHPHVLMCGSGSSFFYLSEKHESIFYINRRKGEWY